MLDRQRILQEHNLQMVEERFFRDKNGVSKVRDKEGNIFVLKTEQIEPFQIKLFQLVKEMEGELCFKVPKAGGLSSNGKEVLLMEDVTGRELNEYIDKKINWVIDVSKKYPLIIKRL